MSYTSVVDFLDSEGIHDTGKVNGHSLYLCPLHHDTHPSFYAYNPIEHWHFQCYSCDEKGSLVYLIKKIKGVDWVEAYNIMKGKSENKKAIIHETAPKIETPRFMASPFQQEAMTIAMEWWHERLLHQFTGKQARYDLLKRGVSGYVYQQNVQIGYAPVDYDGSFLESLRKALESRFGPMWEEIGLSTGLFRIDERRGIVLRNRGRIMFCCLGPEGRVMYYQGRILSSRQSEKTIKYLGPAGIGKYPFSLPVQKPQIEGTIGMESPFCASVIASYNINNLATMGNGTLTKEILDQFPEPFFWCQDNDIPKPVVDKRTGLITYSQAGEKQAQNCIALCEKLKKEAYRIIPPRITKGVGEWVAASHTITPLIQSMNIVLHGDTSSLAS